jgi:branched-chain amino acid transport system substrate-binding protein
MGGWKRARVRRIGPTGLVVLCAVLALVTTACGASGSTRPKSSGPSSTAPTAAGSVGSTSLGPQARATGTSVKVGLITDGGCCGASAKAEQPVATAAVRWLNQYMDGLAGHPIALDVCVDDLDPGKGTDCANQMIRDNVVAVVIGSNGVIETVWKVLHDVHIPVINNAATNTALLQDSASTFVVNDPYASIVTLPISVAKEKRAKKVSVIVVDLPIATDIFKGFTPRLFRENGLDLNVVPVPLGTPDMTPQAQRTVSSNPDGVVSVIGPDPFCIAAFNGLRSFGFRGTTIAISECFSSDVTTRAIPGDFLNGMLTSSIAPVGDGTDPSMRRYLAVLGEYAKGSVDPKDVVGLAVFQSFGALSAGTRGLTGPVTSASVTAALKAMKNEVLPASGGRLFRCNGKASRFGAAICSTSAGATTLNAHGDPMKYTLENNTPIGD